MVFASVFMLVLITALVVVSRATTYSKRIVHEWNDDDAKQPSQQILNVVAAMSPAERVALFPALSVVPTSAHSETPATASHKRSAKVRISA